MSNYIARNKLDKDQASELLSQKSGSRSQKSEKKEKHTCSKMKGRHKTSKIEEEKFEELKVGEETPSFATPTPNAGLFGSYNHADVIVQKDNSTTATKKAS